MHLKRCSLESSLFKLHFFTPGIKLRTPFIFIVPNLQPSFLSVCMLMATTSFQWQPLLSSSRSTTTRYIQRRRTTLSSSPTTRRHVSTTIHAFRRSDFDGFAKRVTSGEAWKDAWRNANNGFEQLLYDATKAAERFDRQYSVSRRLSSFAESASYRAREIDRDYAIGQRWRTFTLELSRNSPRYRKQLSDFLNTPLGKSFTTIFFLWFALSGWLFRTVIIATWVLPFAAPVLLGTVAKNFVIEGACPACKKKFVGLKNQVVNCQSCGNIVWQPKSDFYSKGGGKGTKSRSKSEPDIIDVEFEER